MTLVKDNLIQSLDDQLGLSKQSTVLIEKILEESDNALESGDDVLISGFGKFCVRKKAPRQGRSPATGGDLTLDAGRVGAFNGYEEQKE